MRHKTITLCPTTYEIARKKTNFSGWIRQQLLKEHSAIGKSTYRDPIYGAYCEKCDLTFKNPHKVILEFFHYCRTCGEETEYLGELAQ